MQPVAPWLDRLLFAPLAVEAAWLGAGRNFPVGPIADADRGEDGVIGAAEVSRR